MIKHIKIILLLLPFVLFFSCASAPEETLPVSDVPASAAVPADAATADREKAAADEAMAKAKSIKADVAVKEDFNAAMKIYDDAEQLLSTGAGTTAEAAAKYMEAEKAFTAVYDKAFAKREAAREELEKARADIKSAESESDTLEELQAEGGE